MKKLKMLILSLMFILAPSISLCATGHINGCTNTSFDTNCCTKTFKITAQSGYTVTDVIVNGVSQGAISSYTFSNITGPQTLKVVTTATSGSGEGTSGLTGGSTGGTNSNCTLILGGWINGVGRGSAVVNGETLSTGQHILPYGTQVTVTVDSVSDRLYLDGVFMGACEDSEDKVSCTFSLISNTRVYVTSNIDGTGSDADQTVHWWIDTGSFNYIDSDVLFKSTGDWEK